LRNSFIYVIKMWNDAGGKKVEHDKQEQSFCAPVHLSKF